MNDEVEITKGDPIRDDSEDTFTTLSGIRNVT